MKKIISTIIITSTVSSAVEYTNSLLETHFPDPNDPNGFITTELHANIANEDESPGKKGVAYETVYELWATQSDDISVEYKLDTKTVFTGGPAAEITITSADPYTLIPRTRADQPYTVTYSVSDLLSETETDDKRFTSTILYHQGKKANDSIVAGSAREINDNVTAESTQHQPLSLFSGSSTEVHGVITFSMNENVAVDADEFASQSITVLPKHTGSLEGIDEEKIYHTVPSVTINMHNLYPRGDAYLVVFKTSNKGDIEEYRIVQNSQLQNLTQELKSFDPLTISTLNSVIDEKGEWTLQLRVNTPFGDELVDEKQINKTGNIKINVNNVTTQE